MEGRDENRLAKNVYKPSIYTLKVECSRRAIFGWNFKQEHFEEKSNRLLPKWV